MNQLDTDLEWEEWGARDPYFGVITSPEMRKDRFNEVAKTSFFESGRAHVEHLIGKCRQLFREDFVPHRALDFGCGVGRVTLPLAKVAAAVVGADVSDSMLREAEKNRMDQAVTNAAFVKSDDTLSALEGVFDLIHSFIVFQHLEVTRGRQIFANLINRLAPGGIFAAHFTYGKTLHKETFGRPPSADLAPPSVGATDQRGDPAMLMNPYDVNELLFVMQTAGVRSFYSEFTDHGGELGVLLYFQK